MYFHINKPVKGNVSIIRLIIAVLLLFLVFVGHIFAIDIQRLEIRDERGLPRRVFSSSEKINLSVTTTNTDVSYQRIGFIFKITDQGGRIVFSHSGNTVLGSIPGESGSELQNIAIGQFYTTAGWYVLQVEITLDGQVVTSNSITFEIFSPQIVLLYPSDGIRDLVDQPITFRWVSSGATRYRASVSDEPGFYHILWLQETTDDFIQYPMLNLDSRQRLSSSNNYYWKVEGLNSLGSVVAASPKIFSFTVRQPETQPATRDIAVTKIQLDEQNARIETMIKNVGGRPEMNIKLNLLLNGSPVSEQVIDALSPGEEKTVIFDLETIGSGQIVVTVSLVIDDDKPDNNRLTQMFNYTAPRKVQDIAVTDIELAEGSNAENVKINVIVQNIGGNDVTNIPLGLFVNNRLFTTSNIEYIIAGDSTVAHFDIGRSESATVFIGAQLDFADDNLENNLVSKSFTISLSGKLVLQKMVGMIENLISPEMRKELEEYELLDVKIVPSTDESFIGIYVEELEQGKAQVINSWITVRP